MLRKVQENICLPFPNKCYSFGGLGKSVKVPLTIESMELEARRTYAAKSILMNWELWDWTYILVLDWITMLWILHLYCFVTLLFHFAREETVCFIFFAPFEIMVSMIILPNYIKSTNNLRWNTRLMVNLFSAVCLCSSYQWNKTSKKNEIHGTEWNYP